MKAGQYTWPELVRCARCRRLTVRSRAVCLDGAWYGSQCAVLAVGVAHRPAELGDGGDLGSAPVEGGETANP